MAQNFQDGITNRMITFNYAKNTWDQFKKQTIPDTLECMTKSDINTYLNADQSLLTNYQNNQLVPRSSFLGVSTNSPINIGELSLYYDSTRNNVPGYLEYSQLMGAGSNKINRLYDDNLSAFEHEIRNNSNNLVSTLIFEDEFGTNYFDVIFNKIKELTNFTAATNNGWSYFINITLNGGFTVNHMYNDSDTKMLDSWLGVYNEISLLTSYKHYRNFVTVTSGYSSSSNPNNLITNPSYLVKANYNPYNNPNIINNNEPFTWGIREVTTNATPGTPECWNVIYTNFIDMTFTVKATKSGQTDMNLGSFRIFNVSY